MFDKQRYWALARRQTTANFWRFAVISGYELRHQSGHYFGLKPLHYVIVGLEKYCNHVDKVLGMTSYECLHD